MHLKKSRGKTNKKNAKKEKWISGKTKEKKLEQNLSKNHHWEKFDDSVQSLVDNDYQKKIVNLFCN